MVCPLFVNFYLKWFDLYRTENVHSGFLGLSGHVGDMTINVMHHRMRSQLIWAAKRRGGFPPLLLL